MSTDSKILDELDRDFSPAWRPQPGEKVAGIVTDQTERDGGFGRYPIVTMRQENGEEIALHCFHEVLQGELARIAPKVGDMIGVAYRGKHPERGYHQYRVRRAGGDSGVDWGRYSADTPAAEDTEPAAAEAEPDVRGLEHLPAAQSSRATSSDSDIPF